MPKNLYVLLLLFFTPFLTTQALAGACTDITADDAATTISEDCTDLNISGDNTTTTINSGVTIDETDAAISTGTSTGATIINSGTISASDDYAIYNQDGTIKTLSNSGTISADDDYTIYNQNSTITTLTNSGTISAGDNYTIYNQGGTITTFTNTGTLSSGSGKIDVYNSSGTITTFNNDQGKVDSDYVAWSHNLPTNYNVIINSTSDYGITTFNSISGTLNFGIYSTSSVEEGDTTYSSVLRGLNSSHINNTTGYSNANNLYYWTLVNSSGTIWDLQVQNATVPTKTSLTTEVAPTLRTAFNFADTMSFAHINTYDCDTFGAHNWCFSVGGRGTMIANASKHSSAFLLGKKFSKQFRVALF